MNYTIDYMMDTNTNNLINIKLINNIPSSSFIKDNINFIIIDPKFNNSMILKYNKILDSNIRNQTLIKINNLINSFDKAILIEAGIYEYSLLYILQNEYSLDFAFGVYNDKLFNILTDFEYIKTHKLELLDNPQGLAFLEPSIINVDSWKEVKRIIDLREYKKNNINASDLYKCKKCGEKKCSVYELQTRSADEPATLFITCLVCYTTFRK